MITGWLGAAPPAAWVKEDGGNIWDNNRGPKESERLEEWGNGFVKSKLNKIIFGPILLFFRWNFQGHGSLTTGSE